MKKKRSSWTKPLVGLAALAVGVIAPLAPAVSAEGASSQAVGVTNSTIKLGITYIDLSTVQQYVHGLNQGNFKGAYQALINNINKSGGIDGRKIQAYYEAISPLGTASAQAACTQLTEEDHVFAVTGYFQANDPLCYVQLHSTPLIGGAMTTALLAQAKAPWFSPNPILDVLEPATANAAAKAGVFKNKKVAVVSQSDAPAGLASSVLATLKKDGIKPVSTATIQVNASDPAASQQSITGVIAQKFQSSGAQVVVAVGNAGQSWPTAMENQTYRPTLVATNYGVVQSYASTSGKGLAGSLTANVAPLATSTKAVGWAYPYMQRCANIVKASGQHVDSPVGNPDAAHQTFGAVQVSCQNLALFEAITKRAGRSLTDASFTKAGNTLGNVAPGLDGYSKAARAGVNPLYLYHWDATPKRVCRQSETLEFGGWTGDWVKGGFCIETPGEGTRWEVLSSGVARGADMEILRSREAGE